MPGRAQSEPPAWWVTKHKEHLVRGKELVMASVATLKISPNKMVQTWPSRRPECDCMVVHKEAPIEDLLWVILTFSSAFLSWYHSHRHKWLTLMFPHGGRCIPSNAKELQPSGNKRWLWSQVFTFNFPLQAEGSRVTLDILSADFPNYKIGLRKHTLLYKERSAIPGWIYAEMR